MKTNTGMLLLLAFAITNIVAWFNHIFTCFAEEAWGFLIAGALFFPVGIVHGYWLWFQ